MLFSEVLLEQGVDVEKERIGLGVKQLSEDPFASAIEGIKKGETITCTVSAITEGGLEVTVSGALKSFIRRADLSRERSEQRPDRYAVWDRIDARVTNVVKRDRKISLSVKAHEMAEEIQAMEDYGSSDSGASLGDILGAALSRAREDEDAPDELTKLGAFYYDIIYLLRVERGDAESLREWLKISKFPPGIARVIEPGPVKLLAFIEKIKKEVL